MLFLFVLLNQDLREECLKLRTRVFDLEQQNRALGVLFQQKIKPASDLLLQVRCPSQNLSIHYIVGDQMAGNVSLNS